MRNVDLNVTVNFPWTFYTYVQVHVRKNYTKDVYLLRWNMVIWEIV